MLGGRGGGVVGQEAAVLPSRGAGDVDVIPGSSPPPSSVRSFPRRVVKFLPPCQGILTRALPRGLPHGSWPARQGLRRVPTREFRSRWSPEAGGHRAGDRVAHAMHLTRRRMARWPWRGRCSGGDAGGSVLPSRPRPCAWTMRERCRRAPSMTGDRRIGQDPPKRFGAGLARWAPRRQRPRGRGVCR